jgi:hypothetical protein
VSTDEPENQKPSGDRSWSCEIKDLTMLSVLSDRVATVRLTLGRGFERPLAITEHDSLALLRWPTGRIDKAKRTGGVVSRFKKYTRSADESVLGS